MRLERRVQPSHSQPRPAMMPGWCLTKQSLIYAPRRTSSTVFSQLYLIPSTTILLSYCSCSFSFSRSESLTCPKLNDAVKNMENMRGERTDEQTDIRSPPFISQSRTQVGSWLSSPLRSRRFIRPRRSLRGSSGSAARAAVPLESERAIPLLRQCHHHHHARDAEQVSCIDNDAVARIS